MLALTSLPIDVICYIAGYLRQCMLPFVCTCMRFRTTLKGIKLQSHPQYFVQSLRLFAWAEAKDLPINRTLGLALGRYAGISVIELARESENSTVVMSRHIEIGAAETGRVHVLNWLKGRTDLNGRKIATIGARFGHDKVVNWVNRNDIASNMYVREALATEYGADYLKDEYTANVCAAAARGGHKDLLRKYRKAGYDYGYETASMAAEGGYLDILEWLKQNGNKIDFMAGLLAAKAGHWKIVQWLMNNHYARLLWCYVGAIRGCQSVILQNLQSLEPIPQERSKLSRESVIVGRIDYLQIFFCDQLKEDTSLISCAVHNKHLPVATWLLAQGCHADPALSLVEAISGENIEAIPWIISIWGREIMQPGMAIVAAKRGQPEMLKCLAQNGLLGNAEECLKVAKDYKTREWLYQQIQTQKK